ncbi:MAG: enoyl-CoA hydratase [Mariniblastus sp.]|jgi:enoyl-CoA hydratase
MIDVSSEAGIAVVQMNYGKVNAMDVVFCRKLTRVLAELAEDDTQAVVLTGNERVFSAGVDLVAILEGGLAYQHDFLPALVDCFKAIFQFPKPLVAAINGHAIAGGCVLASACDRRLIHDRAQIGISELRVGVPLPAIAIEIMRFAAAHQALQAMVTDGQTYRGEEALQVGLVDDIVPKQELVTRSIDEAQSLLTIPARVFAVTKQQLRAPANRMVTENEKAFDAEVFKLWATDEIQQVIGEFVADRL